MWQLYFSLRILKVSKDDYTGHLKDLWLGSQIGKKDHATVLYACKAVTDLIETDRNFKIQVEEIQRKLYCRN